MRDPELYPCQSSTSKASEEPARVGGYQPRTRHGHLELLQEDVIRRGLSTVGTNLRDRDGSFALLPTPDGEADLYGIDDLRTGFMANHLSGMAIRDTLYEAATLGP